MRCNQHGRVLMSCSQHKIKKIGCKMMGAEQVLTSLERTIKKVCVDIKKKNGAVGSDKLDSLSKLTNSYSRLLERQRPDEKKVAEKSGSSESPMSIYRRR